MSLAIGATGRSRCGGIGSSGNGVSLEEPPQPLPTRPPKVRTQHQDFATPSPNTVRAPLRVDRVATGARETG